MSFFSGTSSLSAARGAALPGITPTRSDLLGRKYQPFANPFFDHANTYLPTDVKQLFRYCRFYHMTHGVINAVMTKASEYAVTDLIIQHKERTSQDRWSDLLLRMMNYRVLQYEVNLDYNVMGNAFVSVSFPFRKELICGSCNKRHDAIKSRSRWKYDGNRFTLTCDSCGQTGHAQSMDKYTKNFQEITLIRWNPEHIDVHFNEATGHCDYTLQIPPELKAKIKSGRKDVVATMPEIFLAAVRKDVNVVFDRRELFHMRRPALSSAQRGWGHPAIMPVLKDAFYMQVMKKANEAALLEYILPKDFIFPQPATGAADPFVVSDLSRWRDHLRTEMARMRIDPAYTAIVPFPVGHQSIGGQGRSLLLMPEIQQIAEHIVVGLGFPVDLLFGAGSYAGNNVSMRMLENRFLYDHHAAQHLVEWVVQKIATWLDWPVPQVKFKPFKMADDMQRHQFLSLLNQAKKVSDTTLLSQLDMDVEVEAELIEKDASVRKRALEASFRQEAQLQGIMSIEAAKAQGLGQAEMERAMAAAQSAQRGQPGGAQPQGAAELDPNTMVQQQFDTGLQGPGGMTIDNAQALDQALQSGGVDMRPLPEQLPPRRATLA